MSKTNFGKTVKEIAEKQGVSQSELAKRAKVSRVQINRIFSGATESVRPTTRARIAAALGLSEAEIGELDSIQCYRQKVQEKYEIKSMAGLGFAELQRQPLNTFYVPPNGIRKPNDSQSGSENSVNSSRFANRPGKEKPAADLILASIRSVVLGVPGSGKTTLIQFLATEAAAGRLDGIELPIVVLLPEFAISFQNQPEIDFVDWIVTRAEEVECFGIAEPIRQILKNPLSALFLLDGLDEVPDTNGLRLKVVATIEKFIGNNPDQRFVITSRPSGFDESPWTKMGFSKITLQEYGADQIRSAVQKWSVILSNSKSEPAAKIATELIEAIFENPRVKQLAGNPLILTILILMCKARGYALPRRRVDLYLKIAEVFLDSWEASKRKEFGFRETSSIDLDTRELNWLIGELALAMQRAGLVTAHRWWVVDHLQETLCKRIGFDPQTAKEQTDPILRFISARAGLFEERLPGIFAFAHRTMQEYFAAVGLIEEAEIDPVKAGLTNLLRSHLYHPEWSEVVRLVAAQVNPPRAEDLLKAIVEDPDPAGRFLRRGPNLALRCLADGATVANRQFVQSLFDSLEEVGGSPWLGITNELFESLRMLTGSRYEQAATVTKSRILESAKTKLSDEEFRYLVLAAEGPMTLSIDSSTPESESPVLIGRFCAQGIEDTSYLPNFELDNKSQERWLELAKAWIDRDDLPLEAKRVLIWQMRMAANSHRKQRKRARIRLKMIFRSAASDDVKALAARALGTLPIRKNERDATRYLFKRFLSNKDSASLRASCASALERAAVVRDDVRCALRECMLNASESEEVRQCAASALSESTRHSPVIASSLLELAKNETSESISAACIRSLEPVGERFLNQFHEWLDESNFRTHPAALVLAELYASGRVRWNALIVREVEQRLMEAGKIGTAIDAPNPQLLDAIENLVTTRERHGELRMEQVIGYNLEIFFDRIQYAFVFGSVARNEQECESDIDLMLIGSITLKEVSGAIKSIQSTLGRQVNPTIYSMQNFANRHENGNPFIEDVLRRPKLFIGINNRIPTEEEFNHELGAVATRSMA